MENWFDPKRFTETCIKFHETVTKLFEIIAVVGVVSILVSSIIVMGLYIVNLRYMEEVVTTSINITINDTIDNTTRTIAYGLAAFHTYWHTMLLLQIMFTMAIMLSARKFCLIFTLGLNMVKYGALELWSKREREEEESNIKSFSRELFMTILLVFEIAIAVLFIVLATSMNQISLLFLRNVLGLVDPTTFDRVWSLNLASFYFIKVSLIGFVVATLASMMLIVAAKIIEVRRKRKEKRKLD